jgi:putative chitinase
MRFSEFATEDLSRRGFLRGAAAAAGAAAAGYQLTKNTTPPTENPPPVQKQFIPLSSNPSLETFLFNQAKAAGLKGLELAQFMAQTMHETWNFTKLKEKPMGPKYFAKKYDPKYAPKTAKIIGNTRIGDGEKFHGRGFIQLTGRENYARASKSLGIDLLNNPELAADPKVASQIATWYWNTRVKPNVSDFADTRQVTRQINPALHGLERRHNKFLKYEKVV